MSLYQLMTILLARRKLIIMVFGLVVVLSVIVTLLLPKTYQANASLIINYKGIDPVMGTAMPAQLATGYMSTQVDIISSQNVALKVVDKLKLDETQFAIESFEAMTGGEAASDPTGMDIKDWLSNVLQRELIINPSKDSNVIEVGYRGSDPKFVATVANAFADAYVDTNLQLKVEPALKAAEWFNEQLASYRKKLIETEQKLTAYQQEKGIISPEERWDVENAKLKQLAEELVRAETDALNSSSRSNKAATATAIEENPDILDNALIQNMKAAVGRAEAELASLSQRLNTQHPEYQAALAQVTNLKTDLQNEIDNVTGSLSNSASLSEQRVSELKSALEKQKQRILRLNQQRDELAVLQLDVQSAQQTLDIALERFSQTSMEGETNQSDVSVLTRAVAPIHASSPNVKRNVFLGILLGGFLAVGMALLLELLRPMVRSREDIALPVLGVLKKRRYSNQ